MRENFILANILEFAHSGILNFRETFAYIEIKEKTTCIANSSFREKVGNHKIAVFNYCM